MAVENFFRDRITANFKHTPTDDQRVLFDMLSRFVTGSDSDIFILSGYAGTGKSSVVAAFVRTLKQFRHNFVLLAPTGRAAKVLSGFTGERAFTIHKHIYRQKSIKDGVGEFSLDINKNINTYYIVDEASLITIDSSGSGAMFGSGDLLQDLISFVRRGRGNKLILLGDPGQLPPIGMDESPALDSDFMSEFGDVVSCTLNEVVRQAQESGILYNATHIREMISEFICDVPQMECNRFSDIKRISGGELIESLSDAFDKYGNDEVVVLCRSNKRANRYNAGIRGSVLMREERVNRGDKLMVVKNCYNFLDDLGKDDDMKDFFIANGDVAELLKIYNYEERYGINFAEVILSFPDYNDLEVRAKVVMDTLSSESASLTAEQQKALFEGVWADYDNITNKRKRYEAVREDIYFNALQIKYASAITCHKSQGGQWRCVFIDNPFWRDEVNVEDLKWLYTAITRATEMVFLVNFKDDFFID